MIVVSDSIKSLVQNYDKTNFLTALAHSREVSCVSLYSAISTGLVSNCVVDFLYESSIQFGMTGYKYTDLQDNLTLSVLDIAHIFVGDLLTDLDNLYMVMSVHKSFFAIQDLCTCLIRVIHVSDIETYHKLFFYDLVSLYEEVEQCQELV